MDKRKYLRISKNSPCKIFIGEAEYEAKLINLSMKGLAFIADKTIPVSVNDEIKVSICDDFKDFPGRTYTFTKTLVCYVKNEHSRKGKKRVGCFIDDEELTEYMRQQYEADICKSDSELIDWLARKYSIEEKKEEKL